MSTELPSDKYRLLVVIEGLVFDKQREHKERERSTAPAANLPVKWCVRRTAKNREGTLIGDRELLFRSFSRSNFRAAD
jgi:hypothetical protein